MDIEREVKTVHNVAGYLPGDTAEYVVVGAHYDHLGLGGTLLHGAAPRRHGASGRGRQRLGHRRE